MTIGEQKISKAFKGKKWRINSFTGKREWYRGEQI